MTALADLKSYAEANPLHLVDIIILNREGIAPEGYSIFVGDVSVVYTIEHLDSKTVKHLSISSTDWNTITLIAAELGITFLFGYQMETNNIHLYEIIERLS